MPLLHLFFQSPIFVLFHPSNLSSGRWNSPWFVLWLCVIALWVQQTETEQERGRREERKAYMLSPFFSLPLLCRHGRPPSPSTVLTAHPVHCTIFSPCLCPQLSSWVPQYPLLFPLNLSPISVNHPALNGCALKSSKRTLLAARILTDANVMCKEEYKALSGKKGQGFIWSIISLNPHSHAVAWSWEQRWH